MEPVSRLSGGVPPLVLTVTSSEKTTLMVMVAGCVGAISGGLLTDCTVGAVVSMTSALLPAREWLLARAGSEGGVVAAAALNGGAVEGE